jgi:Arm DNA-binding domain
LVSLLVLKGARRLDTNMLSDTRVRNAKPAARPIKLSDAGGLHLLIQPRGSKLWRLAYRFAGKQRTLALGIYPIVSLQDARHQRDEAKRQLVNGFDPSAQRRLEKQTTAAGNTFKSVADFWESLRKRVERLRPSKSSAGS